MSNHFLHKSNYQRPFQQIQKDTNTKYHRNKRCPTNSATNLIIKKNSKEKTNYGPKTLFSVSANFSNFWPKISRSRHKQGSANCGILHSRIGEHGVKFGEHEYGEELQSNSSELKRLIIGATEARANPAIFGCGVVVYNLIIFHGNGASHWM